MRQRDDVFELASPELGVLQNRHRTSPNRPEKCGRELDRVSHPQHHLVATTDAEFSDAALRRRIPCAVARPA